MKIHQSKYQYYLSIRSHLLHYAFSKNKLLVYTNERKDEDVKRCVNDSEDCSSHHLIRYILDWQDTYIAILSLFIFIWEEECILSYYTADKIYIWIIEHCFRSINKLSFYDWMIIFHHSHILFNERIKEKFFITCVFLKTTKVQFVLQSVFVILCVNIDEMREEMYFLYFWRLQITIFNEKQQRHTRLSSTLF